MEAAIIESLKQLGPTLAFSLAVFVLFLKYLDKRDAEYSAMQNRMMDAMDKRDKLYTTAMAELSAEIAAIRNALVSHDFQATAQAQAHDQRMQDAIQSMQRKTRKQQ